MAMKHAPKILLCIVFAITLSLPLIAAEVKPGQLQDDIDRMMALSGGKLIEYRNGLVKKWGSAVEQLEAQASLLPHIKKYVADGLLARIRYPDDFAQLEFVEFPRAMDAWRNPKQIPGTNTPRGPATGIFLPITPVYIRGLGSWNTEMELLKKSGDPIASYIIENRIAQSIPNNNATFAFVFETAVIGWHHPIEDTKMKATFAALGDVYRTKAYKCCELYFYNEWRTNKIYELIEQFYLNTNISENSILFTLEVFDRVHDNKLFNLYPKIVGLYKIFKTRIPYDSTRNGLVRYFLNDPSDPKEQEDPESFWYKFAEMEKWVAEHPQPTPSLAPEPSALPATPEPRPQPTNPQRDNLLALIPIILAALIVIAVLVAILRKRRMS